MRVRRVSVVEGKPRNLAERLLWARNLAGLSLRQAAAVTSVSNSMICQYERRGVIPSVAVAMELAHAYRVSLEWLATGEGKARR